MSNKLQELTDKLYNEGLSKGKQEGDEIVAKAKAEAEQIIAEAKKNAESIANKAAKDAEDLKSKVATDLKMASGQTMTALKKQIEEVITAKAIGTPVKEAFADQQFIKGLISSIVSAFNASSAEASDLEVVLSAALKKEMGDKYAAQLAAELGKGVEVTFGKGSYGGFKIGPADGSFKLSFTDEDFTAILCQYLRPATKKILFD